MNLGALRQKATWAFFWTSITQAAVVVSISGVLALAVGVPAAFLWSLARFEVGASFPFSWRTALGISATALTVIIVWRIWGYLDLVSQIHFVNAFDWPTLLPTIQKSKPVTTIVPGAIIVAYAASAILHLKDRSDWIGNAIVFLNENLVTVKFLGVTLRAEDIFRLELAGFVAGIATLLVARISAPHAFARNLQPSLSTLAKTIRKSGQSIPLQDLYRTLLHFREQTARDPKRAKHCWKSVDEDLASLKLQLRTDPIAGFETAASSVEKFPADAPVADMTDELFANTRPILRLVLAAALLVSMVLVLLPIVVRIVTVLFPFLEKGPRAWWAWSAW